MANSARIALALPPDLYRWVKNQADAAHLPLATWVKQQLDLIKEMS